MSKAIDVSVSTGTSRLAVSRALAAIGLASTLLLAGCGSSTAEDTSASSQGAEQNTAEESVGSTAAQTSPDASGETAVPAGDWFDVVYEDSYKSVFLLSGPQITAATGLDVTTVSASDLASALADAELWAGDARSADYADVIATAFVNEGDRLTGTLNALREDDDARLKVFVKHDSHQTFAHVQTGHKGDA